MYKLYGKYSFSQFKIHTFPTFLEPFVFLWIYIKYKRCALISKIVFQIFSILNPSTDQKNIEHFFKLHYLNSHNGHILQKYRFYKGNYNFYNFKYCRILM